MIEELDDILEELADIAGIYECRCKPPHEGTDAHGETCDCRQCWRIGMKDRICVAMHRERGRHA